MPQKVRGKGLWLWTPQGKARAEKAIRDDGGGANTVKSFNTWMGTTEKICKEAISKPIMHKYQGPNAPVLAAGDYKAAVQRDVDAAEVIFEVGGDGSVSIAVGGKVITTKKLW
jgi:hypothetical protein